MPLIIQPNRVPTSQSTRPALLLWVGIGILLAGLFIWAERSYKSPVVYDETGNPILAPHRQKKLEQKVEELEEAEQYALLADANDWYPCFSCPDTTAIFLKVGEVWKYGFSTKGRRRYPESFYLTFNLKYLTQLIGSVEACMKEEIKKIINYPTLPEAQARPFILERPPGNKIDS